MTDAAHYRLRCIEVARRLYAEEGTLEIDDNAKLSEGDDDGMYVQAWVWVNGDALRDAGVWHDG